MVSWDSGSGSHQFGSVGEQQIADLFQIYWNARGYTYQWDVFQNSIIYYVVLFGGKQDVNRENHRRIF